MAKIDENYHLLLEKILSKGFRYEDLNRKGVYRIQIPSYNFTYNFEDGFPAITTKKLYWKGVVGELLWFLRGDTNIKYLVNNNINIWNKDAYNWLKKNYSYSEEEIPSYEEVFKNPDLWNLDLGRIYGGQWRNWSPTVDDYYIGREERYIDQISKLIEGLRKKPMGTDHIVTAWNPAELDEMALKPCHWSFEILVELLTLKDRFGNNWNDSLLDEYSEQELDEQLDYENKPKYQFTLKWHQRSVDTFLGLPFNIASYALLAHIIGRFTNMVPKRIIGDLSNVHIYEPHLDAVKKQLENDVNKYKKCNLKPLSSRLFNNSDNLDDWLKVTDISKIKLDGYKSYPSIPAEMLAYNK